MKLRGRYLLKQVLPYESLQGEYEGQPFMKHINEVVAEKHDVRTKPWVGKHKHVMIWWELENGVAIGWNENPSRGWSFPVARMKKGMLRT